MKDIEFFLIAGYCWSGSSAVVDLLKEYDCNIESGMEFRLIKDPYGINDLFNSLIVKGDPLNYDIAIKDFLWFVRKLNTKTTRFNPGLNYELYFGSNFIKYSEEYIKELTSFKYSSSWWMFDLKKSKEELLQEKINRRILGKLENPQMYFSAVTESEFIKITNSFMDKLFSQCVKNGIATNIILDQGVSVLNCIQEMKFFGKKKLIVVDRDPRDIYTDLCKGQYLIGKYLMSTRNANEYVMWHRAWRKNHDQMKDNEDILFLQFEDLILKYDVVIKKIESFLWLDESNHKLKRQLLNPELSKKNIGIWKSFLNENEIEIFNKELKEYYYEDDQGAFTKI